MGPIAITVIASVVSGLMVLLFTKLVDTSGARRRNSRVRQAEVAVAEIKDGAKLRGELWNELDELRGRVDRLQEQLETSRVENIQLRRQHAQLEAEHDRLQRDHDDLSGKYDQVVAQLEQLRGASI